VSLETRQLVAGFLVPLLDADSPEALEAALDDALANPDLSRMVRVAGACIPKGIEDVKELVALVPAHQLTRLQAQIERMQRGLRLCVSDETDAPSANPSTTEPELDPLSRWLDLKVPLEIGRSVLDTITGTLAVLAVVYAPVRRRLVPEWLVEKLLSLFEQGVTSWLQLLADQCEVPEDLLPADARIDWSAVTERHAQQMLGLDLLVLKARQNGGSLALAEMPDDE
jgi:hypothetical protein